jgi:hypothetical protein
MENAIVFLVEDDALWHLLMKDKLEHDGHKVVIESITLTETLTAIQNGNLQQYGVTVAVVDGYLPDPPREEVWAGPIVAKAIRDTGLPIKIISSSSLPECYCGYGDIHAQKGMDDVCDVIKKL